MATSTDASDDPLAAYAGALGVSVVRGPLDDVVTRLQMCLRTHPCAWFFRICADSPLYDSAILKKMLAYSSRKDLDLVTNVFPRTFPKGQSGEMVSAAAFSALKSARLTPAQKEHATKFFYDNAPDFRIVNIATKGASRAEESLVVDTIEDLRRLS